MLIPSTRQGALDKSLSQLQNRHLQKTIISQIRHSHVLQRINTDTPSNFVSGTFVVSGADLDSLSLHPVSAVPSAMHRSDLVLLSTATTTAERSLRTLPISPYPTPSHTAIRAHFVAHSRPDEPGWTPWIGGTWSKWIPGKVLGYRDFAGRETQVSIARVHLSPLLILPSSPELTTRSHICSSSLRQLQDLVAGLLSKRRAGRLLALCLGRGWITQSKVYEAGAFRQRRYSRYFISLVAATFTDAVVQMFTLPGLQGKK